MLFASQVKHGLNMPHQIDSSKTIWPIEHYAEHIPEKNKLRGWRNPRIASWDEKSRLNPSTAWHSLGVVWSTHLPGLTNPGSPWSMDFHADPIRWGLKGWRARNPRCLGRFINPHMLRKMTRGETANLNPTSFACLAPKMHVVDHWKKNCHPKQIEIVRGRESEREWERERVFARPAYSTEIIQMLKLL